MSFYDDIFSDIYLQEDNAPLTKLNKHKNDFAFINTFNDIITDAMSRYSFNNLPDTVNERVLKHALLFYGNVVFFEKSGNLMALPGRASSDYNVYGDPKNAYVWGVNGFTEEYPLYIRGGDNGTFLREGLSSKSTEQTQRAVYVRENYVNYPMLNYCIQYADAIADTMRTLDTVRAQIKRPYVILAEQSTIPTIKQYFNDVANNDTFVISTGIFNPEKVSVIPLTPSQANIKEVTELIEWYTNDVRQKLGIPTNTAVDKKAQLSVEEVTGGDNATQVKKDKVTDCLCADIETVNSVFGTNITVEFNEGVLNNEKLQSDNDTRVEFKDNGTD